MRKIYYLKTCDTCKRIIKSLPNIDNIQLIEIKDNPITDSQLNEMYSLCGSYEKLFNKRSKLYKERGLSTQTLLENDYKALILEHYTFLSRPVAIIDNQIFIGNSVKVVTSLIDILNK